MSLVSLAVTERTLRTLTAERLRFDSLDDRSVGVLASAAIAESYVDAVLRGLIDTSAYRTDQFTRALFSALEFAMFQSWSSRFDWLRDGFGISLAGSTEAQALDVLVQARNALVHGAGGLTDRQVRDLAELVNLEQRLNSDLDIDVQARRLHLGCETPDKAIAICRRFVRALDATVVAAYPLLRI